MLNKAIRAVILSCMVTSSLAANSGFYIGGQLGRGDLNQSSLTTEQIHYATFFPIFFWGKITSSYTRTENNVGLAGRLFAGYQFNSNWAAELGYIRFQNATISGTASGYSYSSFFDSGGPFSQNLSGSIKAQAVDLVAKAIIPLQNSFNLYGKLGLALLLQRTTLITTTTSAPINSVSLTTNDCRVYPTFGVGAAYDITPNVVADFSWNHIQKVGNATFLANKDLIAAGLAYYFG